MVYQHTSSITCFAEADVRDVVGESKQQTDATSVCLWLASSEDRRLSLVDVTNDTVLKEIPLLCQVAKVRRRLLAHFTEALRTQYCADDQAPGRAVLVLRPLEDLAVGGVRRQLRPT